MKSSLTWAFIISLHKVWQIFRSWFLYLLKPGQSKGWLIILYWLIAKDGWLRRFRGVKPQVYEAKSVKLLWFDSLKIYRQEVPVSGWSIEFLTKSLTRLEILVRRNSYSHPQLGFIWRNLCCLIHLYKDATLYCSWRRTYLSHFETYFELNIWFIHCFWN